MTITKNKRPTDLREACVEEALRIIDIDGLEKLSLREVARRLHVSHQAPYKHFPSRDHILAEIVARAFASFAQYLDNRPKTGDPLEDLGAMGEAYLAYAAAHPLQYRLMFNTPLPDPDAHPEMMRQAEHAFSLLTDALHQLASKQVADDPATEVVYDALFIWSILHGYSSTLGSPVLRSLNLPADHKRVAGKEMLIRIGYAIGKCGPPAPPDQGATWAPSRDLNLLAQARDIDDQSR